MPSLEETGPEIIDLLLERGNSYRMNCYLEPGELLEIAGSDALLFDIFKWLDEEKCFGWGFKQLRKEVFPDYSDEQYQIEFFFDSIRIAGRLRCPFSLNFVQLHNVRQAVRGEFEESIIHQTALEKMAKRIVRFMRGDGQDLEKLLIDDCKIPKYLYADAYNEQNLWNIFYFLSTPSALESVDMPDIFTFFKHLCMPFRFDDDKQAYITMQDYISSMIEHSGYRLDGSKITQKDTQKSDNESLISKITMDDVMFDPKLEGICVSGEFLSIRKRGKRKTQTSKQYSICREFLLFHRNKKEMSWDELWGNINGQGRIATQKHRIKTQNKAIEDAARKVSEKFEEKFGAPLFGLSEGIIRRLI